MRYKLKIRVKFLIMKIMYYQSIAHTKHAIFICIVNLHYQERLHLFQEDPFASFACKNLVFFWIGTGWFKCKAESFIFFQISIVYIVLLIENRSFLDQHQFRIRGDIILEIKVWCFLNSCFLYAGHYCMLLLFIINCYVSVINCVPSGILLHFASARR